MALFHEKYNQRRGRKSYLLLQILNQTLSKHTGSFHVAKYHLREIRSCADVDRLGAVTCTLALSSTPGIN